MLCPDCHHQPSMRAGDPGYCYCHCHDAADAAPELLAACEEVQEVMAIAGKGLESKTYRLVSAAIARATGQTADAPTP